MAVARRRRRHWPAWRTASFIVGLLVCLLVVSSAIGVYDMALFSVHMLGHLMLVMVAPPLGVAGRPLVLALYAVGNPWHTRLKRLLRSNVVSLWFSWPGPTTAPGGAGDSPSTPSHHMDVDEEERALADCNAWLHGLAQHGSSEGDRPEA